MQATDDTTTPATTPSTWADRLAGRLEHAHEAAKVEEVTAEAWVPGAITALWRLFDDAVAQATQALERADLPDRILTRRTGREYWLEMQGPAGERRQIVLFVSLRVADGKAVGGAQITTSQTRAALYLHPTVEGEHLRWLAMRTGTPFTARVVDDLLLSVFGDDPMATRRLAPYLSTETDV